MSTALVIAMFFLGTTQYIFAKNTDTVINQEHFQFYDDDGTTVNNATAKAAIDATTTIAVAEKFHLRLGALQTANKPDITLVRTIKLQFSSNANGDCTGGTGSWADVPTNTGWASQAFRQGTTTNFTDGDATTARLDGTHSHIGGDGVSGDGSPNSASFTTGATANTEHAEWEWVLDEMAGTEGVTYWFRFINSDGTTTNVAWATCASITVPAGNSAPVVSAVNIAPATIVLTENGTTTVTVTATIADANGCTDVFTNGTATATLYRSSLTSSCSADANNCYRDIPVTNASCSGTSDNGTGTVQVWYIAQATDASSSFDGDTWQAEVKAIDAANASSTATDGTPPELSTLLAISVTGSINYGTVAVNATSTTQTVTITNTGNYNSTDANFSGVNLEFGANNIAVGQQRYSTTTTEAWDYMDYTLDGTPTRRELNITKGTATGTPSTQNNFWAIQVLTGQAAGTYTGTSTITGQ